MTKKKKKTFKSNNCAKYFLKINKHKNVYLKERFCKIKSIFVHISMT